MTLLSSGGARSKKSLGESAHHVATADICIYIANEFALGPDYNDTLLEATFCFHSGLTAHYCKKHGLDGKKNSRVISDLEGEKNDYVK